MTTLRKNQWEPVYVLNYYSKAVMDYLVFSPYHTLDELISISDEETVKLLDEYNEYLDLNYKQSVIDMKRSSIWYFYKVNGLTFIDPDSS